MSIHPVQQSDLPRIARFVAGLNADPTHNICFFGDSEAEVLAWLEGEECAMDACFYASDGQVITGFLGVDHDRGMGRAWLHGPLVQEPDWEAVSAALYDAVLGTLPEEITVLEFFGERRNERLAAFATHRGYTTLPVSLSLSRGAEPELASPDWVEALAPDGPDVESVITLHEQIFPTGYYTGRQLVEKAAAGDMLLIARRDEGVRGYLFLQVEPAGRAGYIDFIGVAETARNQGLGRGLLGAAVSRALSVPGTDTISLTVREANTSALRMYAAAGFRQRKAMVGYVRRSTRG